MGLRLIKKRPVLLIFAVLLLYMVFEVLFLGNTTFTSDELSTNQFDERDEWYETNSTVCDLPFNMDPYDPIIKSFIKRLPHDIRCYESDENAYASLYNLYQGKSLSYMNDNDPIVRIFRVKEHDKSLKCLYRPFDRDGESDDDLKYFEEKPIIGHKLNLEKINVEFVSIKCYFSGKFVYSNIHSWPTRVNNLKITSLLNSSRINQQPSLSPSSSSSLNTSSSNSKSTSNSTQTNGSPYKPSVMFLIIESMSYLNFKRFMIKTSDALGKLSNMFYLRGLNKVADNSYPNMMPILSGFRPYYEKWPFNDTNEDGPFDNIPFIWQDFKASNYTTGYVEDTPFMSLFNYLFDGFRKPPTDWYPRPYWLEMDSEQGIEKLSLCYKQQPKILLWLKQIKQFINKATKTNQPFFLWSFYILATHNDFNKAHQIDTYIADFINSYLSVLEDTIFIVMGDHGNRFGALSKTGYGQIETRMPLFSIHIPPKLLSKHRHLSYYLKKNEKRLSTWLDVREILKDIISGDYHPIVSSTNKTGYSFWREEIPITRTCQEALIPLEFCLCSKKYNVPINSQTATEVSVQIIDHLNEALSKYINESICYPLSLKEIQSVKKVQIDRSKKNHGTKDRIEMVLTLNPSDAIIQVQLYKSNNGSQWSLEGDVSRLNSYSNQSICIQDRVLRKYCYCRNISSRAAGT